jgi:hypothetical protein
LRFIMKPQVTPETAREPRLEEACMATLGTEEPTPLDAAQRSGAADLAAWLRGRGPRSPTEPNAS